MPRRFEEQVQINLLCGCPPTVAFPDPRPREMKLGGNLSYRETGDRNTTLAYSCERCFRRVAVVDEWPMPSRADLEAIDATP